MKVTRHDDVIKWKHFPRNWPIVRGIHRSPVNSHHKGQWRGTLMFSLISVRINVWVNNGEAGDLRHNRAHCDVIVMKRICQMEYISSIIDTIRALPYFVVVSNTLRPRQDGRQFPDDIFKRIFLNENVIISIKISLKFVPKGPINNNPALVQIMAWRRSDDKP